MTIEIKRILHPTDLSDHAKHVFAYAKSQALALDAELVVLHVVEPLSKHTSAVIDSFLPSGAEGSKAMYESGIKRLQEQMRARVAEFCDELLQENEKRTVSEVRVVQGPTAQTILDQARDMDMVVMGSHGHSALGDLVLGSVAHKVVHRARLPVMLVPFE